MPISSGANGWPKSYYNERAPSPTRSSSRTILVESRQASPRPSKRLPSPEVVRTEEHLYEGSGYDGGGGTQTSTTTTKTTTTNIKKDAIQGGGGGKEVRTTSISKSKNIDSSGGGNQVSDYYTYGEQGYGRYGPNGRMTTNQNGEVVKYSSSTTKGGYWRTGPDGNRVFVSANSSAYYDSYGRVVQQDGGKTCCFFGGNDYFSTNQAGAGAGCCNGGLFGNRGNALGSDYVMKGTGRKRCCACLLGLLLALALLGLLLGMLLGLRSSSSNDQSSREEYIRNTFYGGYFLNGVYYYPVTSGDDTYYFAMGHLVPCNKFNNNTDQRGPTTSFEVVTDDATATAEITLKVTEPRVITIPNCNEITTDYILAQNYTPSVTRPSNVILVAPAGSVACISTSNVLVLLFFVLLTFFMNDNN